MASTIFLIRHGETDWNRLRRVQGSIDVPLNPLGEEQASKLYLWFKDRKIDMIYSSDLMRAFQTATILASKYKLGVKTCSELRERSYGLIEGKSIEQFNLTHSHDAKDWLELEKYEIEPLLTVKNRIYTKINHILRQHTDQSIAIVSHGGTIKAFLAMITNGETGSGKIKIDNTSVTEIEYHNGNYRIVTLNDTSHLGYEQENQVV